MKKKTKQLSLAAVQDVIIKALTDHGPMSATSLTNRMGSSLQVSATDTKAARVSAVRRACLGLVAQGQLDKTRKGLYSVRQDRTRAEPTADVPPPMSFAPGAVKRDIELQLTPSEALVVLAALQDVLASMLAEPRCETTVIAASKVAKVSHQLSGAIASSALAHIVRNGGES